MFQSYASPKCTEKTLRLVTIDSDKERCEECLFSYSYGTYALYVDPAKMPGLHARLLLRLMKQKENTLVGKLSQCFLAIIHLC